MGFRMRFFCLLVSAVSTGAFGDSQLDMLSQIADVGSAGIPRSELADIRGIRGGTLLAQNTVIARNDFPQIQRVKRIVHLPGAKESTATILSALEVFLDKAGVNFREERRAFIEISRVLNVSGTRRPIDGIDRTARADGSRIDAAKAEQLNDVLLGSADKRMDTRGHEAARTHVRKLINELQSRGAVLRLRARTANQARVSNTSAANSVVEDFSKPYVQSSVLVVKNLPKVPNWVFGITAVLVALGVALKFRPPIDQVALRARQEALAERDEDFLNS